MDKGKHIVGSTSVALEERLDEPLPKIQKIIREQAPQVEEYSPTQSPLQTGDEWFTREQMEQLGSQREIFITQDELEEGNLQEPPIPSLELIVVDCGGKELVPMIEHDSHEFLSDDNFVKTRAFHQFS